MDDEKMAYAVSGWKAWLDRFDYQFDQKIKGMEWSEDIRYDARSSYTHCLSQFPVLFKGDIPKEVLDSAEFRSQMVQILIEKLKDKGVRVDKSEMVRWIELSPEAIKDIDLLYTDDDSNKQWDVILGAITDYKIRPGNPGVIDLLPIEKLVEIAKSYEEYLQEFQNTPDESLDRYYHPETQEIYRERESSFIVQLIKTNPKVLETEHVQEMIKEDPELKKAVRIFMLEQRKRELLGEIAEADRELAVLRGREIV